MSSIAAIVVFVVTFAFVAHHAMMLHRIMTRNETKSRVDTSRATHYDYVNASFNRHGRAIVRNTNERRHVI